MAITSGCLSTSQAMLIFSQDNKYNIVWNLVRKLIDSIIEEIYAVSRWWKNLNTVMAEKSPKTTQCNLQSQVETYTWFLLMVRHALGSIKFIFFFFWVITERRQWFLYSRMWSSVHLPAKLNIIPQFNAHNIHCLFLPLVDILVLGFCIVLMNLYIITFLCQYCHSALE